MDKTQRGVARGMGLAMATAIVAFTFSATYVSQIWGVGSDLPSRVMLAAWAVLSPAATLFVCIARLAKHRFFTPEDMHGSALTSGTDRAKLLQTLLQNTWSSPASHFPSTSRLPSLRPLLYCRWCRRQPPTPMSQTLGELQLPPVPELLETERQFAAAGVDPLWSEGMEGHILGEISQLTGLKLVGLQVECKTTLCRLFRSDP